MSARRLPLRAPDLWNAPQRRVIIILLIAILSYLTVRLTLNPMYVSDPQPRDPPRAVELADKIDPNTADAATLSALPMIGPKRAQDIIDFREQFLAQNPGRTAFTQLEDLLRIKGFGPAMIEHLRPYLIFPRTNAATTPSAPPP